MSKRTIAIFDFGGVLIDWDPRHLYRKIFGEDVAAMEHFLSNVCTPERNLCQDAGRSFAEGTAALARKHPEMAALIEAWQSRLKIATLWRSLVAGTARRRTPQKR